MCISDTLMQQNAEIQYYILSHFSDSLSINHATIQHHITELYCH
jgi:hypothetical protein